MDHFWTELAVLLTSGYLAAGFLFALPFVVRGVNRIDSLAVGGSWGFRLAILPGAAVFWPILLVRWVRGASPPEESNAHRRAARASGRLEER